MSKLVDITGIRFGRLLVLKRAGVAPVRKVTWLCKCDCGKEVIVRGGDLHSLNTRSCGCLNREEATKRLTGINHPNWHGGRSLSTGGYIKTKQPKHPRADDKGYVFEHILVMEKMLGHPLPEGAVVHHCDKNPRNNSPFNLRLFMTTGEHTKYHRHDERKEAV